MVFHGSRLIFKVPGRFSWFFRVPGWFFIFHAENTLKLYSGLTIQSWPYRPSVGFGLVLVKILKLNFG